jgi:Family of unknown function (DUF6152)
MRTATPRERIPNPKRVEHAMRRLLLSAAAALWMSASLPAEAHHAFAAEYDADKPFELTGTLTKIEWVNPHSWIYIDVKTPDGKVTSWQFEFGAPNALVRRGLHKSDLPIGGEVHVLLWAITLPTWATYGFGDLSLKLTRTRSNPCGSVAEALTTKRLI